MKHFLNEHWSKYFETNQNINTKIFFFRLCQRYDIIQKLLWITMTYLPVDRVEVPIGLIAQLSYYQEE